jgi:hypothetical protein
VNQTPAGISAGALLLISLLFLHTGMASASSCMPYVGERMSFSVGWEFIHGGSAQMNVLPMGKDGYRITSTARSNKVLDLFHKVRDRMVSEGLCVQGKMQSTMLDIEQHESKYHSKKHADFLWRDNKVIYRLNENVETFDVPAGHLNVIDAFFATRLMELKVGKTVNIPIFDARKRYEVVVKVLRKDRIKAPWGERVECLVIEPKLKTAGIFSSRGKVKVWLTNDQYHIPLKLTARLKFGRIIARLTHYERAD